MKIYISATLRSFFGRNAGLEARGNNLNDILQELIRIYPDSEKVLKGEDGKPAAFIRIFAGEEDMTDPARHGETLKEGTELLFLPVIAGGSPNVPLVSDERRKEVNLDDKEIERFNKHLLLREIGVKGQKRIKAAKVTVFGAGALGSPVIQYLAAAGVGSIRIVDPNEVRLEDLQCQVLHSQRDLKRPKAASAKDKVRNINRDIEVTAENLTPDAGNVMSLIEGSDLVIDCSDNFRSRYIINDACVLCGIPLVFGAVYQFEGMVSVLNHENGPCLRCLFPEPPAPGLVPTCAEGGTISPLSGIIGSIQANEALKLIMGVGETLSGRLLRVDSFGLRSDFLKVKKNAECRICSAKADITEVEDFDYEEFCGLKQDENEIPVEGFTVEELTHRIESGDPLTIVDVREPHERAILRFPGAKVIPIGQLARRQNELSPDIDTVFICKQGKRSILAINTLREAGYKGPMYNLKGGMDAMKDVIFSNEGGWL